MKGNDVEELVDEVRRLRRVNKGLREDLAWAARQYKFLARYLDAEFEVGKVSQGLGLKFRAEVTMSEMAAGAKDRQEIVASVMDALAESLCFELSRGASTGIRIAMKGPWDLLALEPTYQFPGPAAVRRWERIAKAGDPG